MRRARNRTVFKDFDLPVQHLVGEHYVPPKARHEPEAHRRRRLPKGSLIAEHQLTGLRVATHILGGLREKEDITYGSKLLAASGINTAWYGYAQHSDFLVMRRRLKLPVLTALLPEWRPNSEVLLQGATRGFEVATYRAKSVVSAIEHRSPRTRGYQIELGRTLGNASLTLACVELGDMVAETPGLRDDDIQGMVRERSLRALIDSRDLAVEIGSNPSIAQLADPNSDLSIHWRRTAPNGALEALQTAIEAIPQPDT